MMQLFLSVGLLICSLNMVCFGQNTPPKIEFLKISSDTLRVSSLDSISITIGYEDLDGDLGENNTDSSNLFVFDSQFGIDYGLRIPLLLDTAAPGGVKGQITVVLNDFPITEPKSFSRVTYEIEVKDRAGNSSNKITTPDVYLWNPLR
jgi:hypothetical protein